MSCGCKQPIPQSLDAILHVLNGIGAEKHGDAWKTREDHVDIDAYLRHEHYDDDSEHSNIERNYFCHEISTQSFERWVQLPYAVKEDAEAHYDNGVLHIALQELAPHKARQIEVKRGPRSPQGTGSPS